MKILLAVEPDEFFMPRALDGILSRSRGQEIVVAWVVPRLGWRRRAERFRWQLALFRPAGVAKLLFRLAGNYLRSAAGRLGRVPTIHRLADVTRKHRLRPLLLDDINSPAVVRMVRDEGFDLIFSFQSSIFGRAILSAPRIGCVNKHAALLPAYRGVWPVFWALLHDEHEAGLSLHWMDERLDTGPVIVQRAVPISETDTLFTVYDKAFACLPDLFHECLAAIGAGNRPPGDPQPPVSGRYFSFPDRGAMSAFHRRKRII